MNIRKFRNGTIPGQYLVSQLSSGFSPAATLVLKHHDFTRGSFFVVAPGPVDIDQLSEFRWEISGVDRLSAIRLLGKMTKGFVSDRRASVVLQDFWHRPSDPVWEQFEHKDRAIAYRSEIYWGLQGREITVREIEEMISHPSYWPFSAFFAISSSIEPKKVFTDADLEELARNLVGVAVDAFDANSFVIWWREDLLPFPTTLETT